jgi:hypothetical protein
MSFSLCACALALAQVAVSPVARITEPVPLSSVAFGSAIEVETDTLAIASRAIQRGYGVVHVYRGHGANWTLEAELQDPTPKAQNHFGRALALEGDELFVGGMQDGHSSLGAVTGSVNIFHRIGTTWSHAQLLEPSIPVDYGGYANDLKVVGDTLVVTGYGRLYVYRRQGTTWVEETTLPLTDVLMWGHSHRLAFDGLRIVVGAGNNPLTGLSGAGRIHVFVRTPSGWMLEQVLSASDESVNSFLGMSVAIDGERIAAGAIGGPNQTYTGAAYVFERVAGTWREVQRIDADDGAPGQDFGRSITLVGDRLYVGAAGADVGTVHQAGALYVFDRSGSGWRQRQKFELPSPSTNAEFGWRQARYGDYLFVAATSETHSNLQYAGAVHALKIEPTPSTYCPSATTTHGCQPRMSGSGVASASANSGFLLRADFVEGSSSGLFFYGVSGSTFLPWSATGGAGYLCVKPPTQRMPLQNSGGAFGTCNGALQTDWNAFRAGSPVSLGEPFSGGAIVNAQAWFRDSGATKTTALSNALEFVVQP